MPPLEATPEEGKVMKKLFAKFFSIGLMLALAVMLVTPPTTAWANGLKTGGFSGIQGTLRHCELSTGSHSNANSKWAQREAKARGLNLVKVSARQMDLTLVHMDPMAARNYHATAIWNGQRVPVCVPAPGEKVWAVKSGKEYVPILMDSCRNKVIAYATATKHMAKKIYDRVDGGEGGGYGVAPDNDGGTSGGQAPDNDGGTSANDGGTSTNDGGTSGGQAPDGDGQTSG